MDHTTRASTSSASSARLVDVLVPVALNRARRYGQPANETDQLAAR